MVGFLSILLSFSSGEELQTVEETEFIKLITEENYVVALFCPTGSLERCEEFEGELASIREDMIDVMDGDGWVVKLMDSPFVEEYAVGKTNQPVIVMFRNGLPVIYDGRLYDYKYNWYFIYALQAQLTRRSCWTPWSGTRSQG